MGHTSWLYANFRLVDINYSKEKLNAQVGLSHYGGQDHHLLRMTFQLG